MRMRRQCAHWLPVSRPKVVRPWLTAHRGASSEGSYTRKPTCAHQQRVPGVCGAYWMQLVHQGHALVSTCAAWDTRGGDRQSGGLVALHQLDDAAVPHAGAGGPGLVTVHQRSCDDGVDSECNRRGLTAWRGMGRSPTGTQTTPALSPALACFRFRLKHSVSPLAHSSHSLQDLRHSPTLATPTTMYSCGVPGRCKRM